MADVTVQNEGTIYLFHLESEEAREWAAEHVEEGAQYLGDALAVEHRYAHDLAIGMIEAGLEVE